MAAEKPRANASKSCQNEFGLRPPRQVLDCGSHLPLSVTGDIQSGRGLPQSKTLARVNGTGGSVRPQTTGRAPEFLMRLPC
jgi:hypothetical protein